MVDYTRAELEAMAEEVANGEGIPRALFFGLIHNESSWRVSASRYEGNYQKVYIDGHPMLGKLSDSVRRDLATSFGLCQVIPGTVATMPGVFGIIKDIPALIEKMKTDPMTQLRQGAAYFKWCMTREDRSINKALHRYNGGGNPWYADRVLALAAQYGYETKEA